MTRARFLSLVVGGVLLAALAGGAGSAAPIPKGAYDNTTPDLKAFFTAVSKAVEDGKWPAEADEKKLRDTARLIFDRTTKAAEQKDRKLPVDFDRLKKLEVVSEYKADTLDGNFVIAKDVHVRIAKNSVIFASGDVQITSAQNCVIVTRNVGCTSVDHCFIAAGEFIRLTGARRLNGSAPSILVAGQWIRTTSMDGTICHVMRPSGLPAPDEGKLRLPGPHPAIRTNGAEGVIFLNEQDQTGANRPMNCTYLPQKTPIAK
jgi:hypothetical protein